MEKNFDFRKSICRLHKPIKIKDALKSDEVQFLNTVYIENNELRVYAGR